MRLAKQVGRAGGTYPAVFNAANEQAVDAFHEGRLPFLGIVELIERVVDARDPEATSGGTLTRESLAEAERWARDAANQRDRRSVGREPARGEAFAHGGEQSLLGRRGVGQARSGVRPPATSRAPSGGTAAPRRG